MRFIKIFFILNLLLILSFNKLAYSKIEQKIVVKVENEIITNYDIKNKILLSLIISNQEINQENINQIKSQVLDFLVQSKLKKIQLKNKNYKINSFQINSYLNSVSKGDLNSLKEKLRQNNINFEMYVEEIENELKWQRFIFDNYSKKIKIDEDLINKQLKMIKNDSGSVESYKLSEIEVLSSANKNEQNIKNIEEQISKFGFASTALKFSISPSSSNGGDIGWINEKTMSKRIYKIISNLKIGEVSKPIRETESILFFKLDDKKLLKKNNVDLTQLKNELINKKKNELFNLYSRSHLSKLKNNSFIEYK